MTDESPSGLRPSNDARRAAREKARALRKSQRRKDRRNRVLLRGGLVVALVAIVAIVAFVIVSSIRPPHRGPANMASDGVLIGQGLKAERSPARAADAKPTPHPLDTSGQVVNIVTYVDYLCQYCGAFERTNSEQISKLVSSGAATLEIHPLPFYANSSAQGTQYSLRAANAAACVANYSPDKFFNFNRLMFEHEPKETSAGLSNSVIAGYARQAGASPIDKVRSCIDNKTYGDWMQGAESRDGRSASELEREARDRAEPAACAGRRAAVHGVRDGCLGLPRLHPAGPGRAVHDAHPDANRHSRVIARAAPEHSRAGIRRLRRWHTC